MKTHDPISRIISCAVLLWLFAPACNRLPAADTRQIPDPLKTWEDWATWAEQDRVAPTPYQDSATHLTVWPSALNLSVEPTAGQFDLALTVYHDDWVVLPGSAEVWPFAVKANGSPVPVVEHNGKPSVRLLTGVYQLTGTYQWDEMPQRIVIPQEIGILTFSVEGKVVDNATWDADGFLWLKRDRAQATDKDFLGIKMYRMIEDGIPMWLHSQMEIRVSGKSREEDLRTILPEGWQLAAVDSPIPVAIDEKGHMKAQVRAGKWTISFDAFHLTSVDAFGYAAGTVPLLKDELIAFQAAPDFRLVQVEDIPSIDVSQTTFPDAWRNLPVYHWETAVPFHLVERMRGMGLQKPAGLTISRQLWLDESGSGMVFRDSIIGSMQRIWRLDAAEDQDLGSVRSDGVGQLITRNPGNGASGVEIRSRNLNLDATGRMNRTSDFSATGWRTDADGLTVTLNLPPGWRLFALFGADWVHGDWLTAWSLLDLFLLLVFSLAVYRLAGVGAGVLAFVAFGLAYQEPGAPRLLWILLLIPLGLLKVARAPQARAWLIGLKYGLLTILLFHLIPFLAVQMQQVLYPQLESTEAAQQGLGLDILEALADPFQVKSVFTTISSQLAYAGSNGGADTNNAPAPAATSTNGYIGGLSNAASVTLPQGSFSGFGMRSSGNGNLAYDARAKIQTGPGVPEWSWRTVSFGFNGPVQAAQKIDPLLIPLWLDRVLTILRVGLLVALAWVLLDGSRLRWVFSAGPRAKAIAVALLLVSLGLTLPAQAQLPDKDTLSTLHDRLTETSDAYPTAADIPTVSLSLQDRHVVIDAEIDTAIAVAVPLPGKLPAWSPLTVTVDDKSEVALRRDGDYLWVALTAGVHHVHVEGLLADVTEWEWTFQLKPRRVVIDAPGWTYSGVKADGIPEQQVFFTLKQKSTGTEATYDRQELHTIASLDRHLELGLVWQVHNEITRLSTADRAISIRVPLLPGEKVLTANLTPVDGFIDVRLGANEKSFTWDSELTVSDHLSLATKADDTWVERWYLVASPVWDVSISGLDPVFENDNADLVPVWHPWPGEKADLVISRPEAIGGATVTVHNVRDEVTLGDRQRTTSLTLQLQCSLGEDFGIEIPPDADITSLTQNGTDLPVRKDGTRLIVPLQPADQTIALQWKTNTPLGLDASAEKVVLPVESANIATMVDVPENRWVLWAYGPQQGPAVQFWVILLCAFVGAQVLARLKLSPLTALEWTLLGIGLIQVDVVGLLVVGWLFFLAWRGTDSYQKLNPSLFNLAQTALFILTGISMLIFLNILGYGFLGSPDMLVEGNGSNDHSLQWYQAHVDSTLPQPGCISVSIWWYRLFMLAWALWLAASLVRWLTWGWAQFGKGGFARERSTPVVPPPVDNRFTQS